MQVLLGIILAAWILVIVLVLVSNNDQMKTRPVEKDARSSREMRDRLATFKQSSPSKVADSLVPVQKNTEVKEVLNSVKERNKGLKRSRPEDWVEPPPPRPEGRSHTDFNGIERPWVPPPNPPKVDISKFEVDLSTAASVEKMGPRKFPEAVLHAQPEAIFTIPKGGCNRDNDHARILDRIQVYPDAENEKPKLFCAAYTIKKNHKTQIKSIKHTWGSRCDGFVVFSDQDDFIVPSVSVPHDGPEEYNNIWQKIRSIWKYIYHHYKDDFEWFYIGGDDVYLIVDNLRKYLISDEIVKAGKDGTVPLFLGRRFKLANNDLFNSGGAGYILNRVGLEYLVKSLDQPFCRPNLKTFAEDVQVATCLRYHGIHPYDTQDDWGRERFLPFSPGQHLRYKVPPKTPDWYAKYTLGLKTGYDCCSQDTISFHYIKVDLMYKVHSLLYFCNDVREERDHVILDLRPQGQ